MNNVDRTHPCVRLGGINWQQRAAYYDMHFFHGRLQAESTAKLH